MRIGIIGYGNVGRKRHMALGTDTLAAVYDTAYSCHESVASVDALIARCDAVIVATPNRFLIENARLAVEAGKHVLIEKPGARTSEHLVQLQAVAGRKGVTVHVGYNLRFHPAIMQARAEIGDEPVAFFDGAYCHGGGAHGWRGEDGDGAKLDLGSHLADLAYWFGVDRTNVAASWEEWAPRFELRLATATKLVTVQGLQPGTTYGPESCTVTHAALHAPRVTTTYPGPDGSWAREWLAFRQEIAEGSPGNLDAAIAVLRALNK